jgi:CBS-domain-containing membrane protein
VNPDTKSSRQTLQAWRKSAQRFFGIERETVTGAEKLVSAVGGLLGIFLIAYISYQVTGASGAALIVPSMGASAVLVFAVPHGRLSQPWPLLGGNLVSALVGVTCYKLVPDPFLAAGLAVGGAIGVMHLLGCIHPPGGATALAAIIGGPAIHDLGYHYALTPILLNATIIFVVAIVFNGFFPWRRYPVGGMMRFKDAPARQSAQSERVIDQRFVEQALSDMNLVMDVTTGELQRLFELALQHAEKQRLNASQIRLGHYYTNGKHGPEWSVRWIIDEHCSDDPDRDMVIYRVVEGQGLRRADSCTRAEFARWAAREVVANKAP